MNESIRLGTIAGVRVGINWSVLVIFFLIAFGLSAGRFPTLFPGLSTQSYVLAGLVAAVVFFVSLLAHEVAHAVVARRNGIEVEGITLWLFGGVARLGGEAPDPGADFRIAGVGPLVSIVLAAAFLGLAIAGNAADLPGIAVDVLVWLGIINGILAVFNLVPAAPLDGGRILRAALWRWRGDKLRAAITAARAGRAFGFLLVGLGIAQFVLGAGLGGLWLVLIGWFLVNAAGAEEQHARVRGALGGVTVAEVMTPDPTVAPGDLTVQEFLDDYLLRYRHSAYPLVAGDGGLAGLVTLNRVRDVPAGARGHTRVSDIACDPEGVPQASPDDSLADLLSRMAGCTDGRALVLRDGRVVGIVSPTDVARRLELADLRGPRDVEHV